MVVGKCIAGKRVSGKVWMGRLEVRSWWGSALGRAQAVWDVSLADQSSKLKDARPNEGFASVGGSKGSMPQISNP